MDIKKEIDDNMSFDIEHDLRTMGNVCPVENEVGNNFESIDSLVKNEKVGELDFDSGLETVLFGNSDISFLKAEEDFDDHNIVVNISEDFYENKGAFMISESSDEEPSSSFDIGKNIDASFLFENKKTGTGFNVRDISDEKDMAKRFDNAVCSADGKDSGKIRIKIIKKETEDGFKAELVEDIDEMGKRRSGINYGRKTKKSKDCICDLCSKAFTSEQRLSRHKMQVHVGDKGEITTEVGRYQCKVCQKRFISQSRLTLHSVTHTGEKPFSCEVCGQRFSHPTNQRRHMTKHTGDRPFVCLFCGKSFPAHHALKEHLVKHTGDRPHECKICLMTFAHRFSLMQHELLKHPDGKATIEESHEDRPFTCEECGKKFTQQSALKVHHRLHTGSKPYICDQCDASFTRSDSLKRHKMEHTGGKQFPCNLCEESFGSAYLLKKHRNSHIHD